jgi:hypothetical protein
MIRPYSDVLTTSFLTWCWGVPHPDIDGMQNCHTPRPEPRKIAQTPEIVPLH